MVLLIHEFFLQFTFMIFYIRIKDEGTRVSYHPMDKGLEQMHLLHLDIIYELKKCKDCAGNTCLGAFQQILLM